MGENHEKVDVASVYTNCETAVALFSLAPSECFEGTSFSRFSLSQNVRLFGGSNQGWMKSDDSISIVGNAGSTATC